MPPLQQYFAIYTAAVQRLVSLSLMQSTSIHSTGLYPCSRLGHSSHFRSRVILYWFTWVFSTFCGASGLGSCTLLGRDRWKDTLSPIYSRRQRYYLKIH